MEFYKLHQKAMKQQEKFKNVLQSNYRVQNTEAAADFKAFQVDGILPNSKSSPHYLNPLLQEDKCYKIFLVLQCWLSTSHPCMD